MRSETQFWVFVDKTKIGHEVDAVKIFGSIKAMMQENIKVDGKPLSYRSLRYRLKQGRDKYWENDRYLIRKTPIITSKQK